MDVMDRLNSFLVRILKKEGRETKECSVGGRGGGHQTHIQTGTSKGDNEWGGGGG